MMRPTKKRTVARKRAVAPKAPRAPRPPKPPEARRRPPKVQRWVDILATLLLHYHPVSLDQLAKGVPAYAEPGKDEGTLMMMFERDKRELRKLGVPIETIKNDIGEVRYQLKSRNFYLPYLTVKQAKALTPPKKSRGAVGLQKLDTLAFEPDELVMIARAATRVQLTQHPVLAADAAMAMRKLAFDLAIVDGDVREVILVPFAAQDPAVLEVLEDAVRRSKYLEFDYRSMERNERARRRVAPYGLVFLSGLWYLVAKDEEKQALRHFRVSRVSTPVVNEKNEQKPDFATPADFDLWKHAESQKAWELGDGDASTYVVEFNPLDGHAAAATKLGKPVTGKRNQRAFVVHRPAAFVRWLLSFGGAARPVSPKTLVTMWRDEAKKTAALYATSGTEARS